MPTTRSLADVLAAYHARAGHTDAMVLAAAGLDVACEGGDPPRPGLDLRGVLLTLITETAQHAGHADATREMLDGTRRS